jgi:hypothetical protein
MSALGDRATLTMCIDCATRINDDGQVATVLSDADAMLAWYNAHIEDARARDPLRRDAPPSADQLVTLRPGRLA